MSPEKPTRTFAVDGAFLKGFFKSCSDAGMGEEEVGELFRQQSVAELMRDPEIRRGFFNTLNKHASQVPPGVLSRVMTPASLTEAFLGPNPDAQAYAESTHVQSSS